MLPSYRVKPLSRAKIHNTVRQLKMAIGMENRLFFPVVQVLENILPILLPDFELEIAPVNDMPNKEGETYPSKHKIIIREDIYDKACNNDGRSRYTIAHEIGHLILHENSSVALCRLENITQIKAYENPEWQANEFASELLAPLNLIENLSVKEIQEKCGVSFSEAKIQLSKIH